MMVTNMIEAAATCQRNMCSEIKFAIKCNTKITYSVWWCDAMTKDGRREETNKLSLRQSPSCLRERSVVIVDIDMYTWVSSAYKWWSKLLLWIRELSGVVYRVNGSGPRTEPWGTPQNKGTDIEICFLIFIDWNLFIKNERIQVSAVPDMPYQSDLKEQNNQWRQKLQINIKVLVLWPFLCPCSVLSCYELLVERFL